MSEINFSPKLNLPQARFIESEMKYLAYVAGFGGGKTWAGCSSNSKFAFEYPKVNQGFFAPSYRHIEDIYYPTIEEVVHDWGLKCRISVSNKEVHIYEGRRYRSTIICRSMEDPSAIVGFKIGNAIIDELDVMKTSKAELAWRKIIARMRYKEAPNRVRVTTTPEGFKFVYNQFESQLRDNEKLRTLYGIIRASTYDNAKNLPEDYIPSLLMSYPRNLINAYLKGLFVNLTSGTIYDQFDKDKNHSDAELEEGEPIFVGMDFNVGNMSAIIHVIRNGQPIAVDEVTKGYDTPDMIRIIGQRYWNETGQGVYEKTRQINIYPDASGKNRKSQNATDTDISLLEDAGFSVFKEESNPPVKDRINSMNTMFCNSLGIRRYLVNTRRCPKYTESLQKQVWGKNGEPDKEGGFDHTNDAGGYFIYYQFPVTRRVELINKDQFKMGR